MTTRRTRLQRQRLLAWTVHVRHDGRETTWTRFGRSQSEVQRSALAAAQHEYPGQKIRIRVAPRGH